jgi:hypothetical protein
MAGDFWKRLQTEAVLLFSVPRFVTRQFGVAVNLSISFDGLSDQLDGLIGSVCKHSRCYTTES